MNVLITGSNGFIGSNLMTLLNDISDIKLFAGTRKTIDLYSQKSIREFIRNNSITAIIHCAIEGSGRLDDDKNIVYKNLLMFENLMSNQLKIKHFINIASGAEYDRKSPLTKYSETDFGKFIPKDYYGFSKYIISERIRWCGNVHYINLRIFGCFGSNENEDRMIRKNITNYILNDPIVINQDKYMDFIYIKDLYAIIKFYLTLSDNHHEKHPSPFWRDMNMCYMMPNTKLSDIATMINNLDYKKVPIIIKSNEMGHPYIGGRSSLYAFPINFIGLENGIKECYEKLKLT